jgi:hypothetical protein
MYPEESKIFITPCTIELYHTAIKEYISLDVTKKEHSCLLYFWMMPKAIMYNTAIKETISLDITEKIKQKNILVFFISGLC